MIELKNGRFVDVRAGRILDRTSLHLDENRIAAGGRPGQSIDLGGRTVIPALINTHSHIQMTIPAVLGRLKDLKLNKQFAKKQIFFAMQDCPQHGITTVRDTWTEDLNLNRRLKDKIAKGALTGPRILQCVLVSPENGPFAPKRGIALRKIFSLMGIPYVPHSEPNSGSVTFPPDAASDVVRQAVDRAIDERGADCIKLYDQLEYMVTYRPGANQTTPGQLAAVADQARRRGVPCTMHHLTVDSFRRGVRAGVTSLAHMPYDADLQDGDIRAFVDSACILEPTLSLAYHLCWQHAGAPMHELMDRLVGHRNRTFAAYAKEFWLNQMQESVLTGFERAKGGKTKLIGFFDVAKILRYYSGIVPTGLANVRRLLQAGAKMTCSNDSGAIPATEAMLGPELALFDLFFNSDGNRLFDGPQALRTATIHGAQALGLEDKLGSIEEGKTADLAVLDGNPLEDVRLIGGQVAALFVGGKLVVNRCGLKAIPA